MTSQPATEAVHTSGRGSRVGATARAMKDIALGLSPAVPGGSAFAFDAVTPDELTRAIARDVAGARIEQIDVQPHSSGTADRALLRLHWNAAGSAAGLPVQAFAKGTPSAVPIRAMTSTFGLGEGESRFYRQLAPSVADLTIRPYVARHGSGGRYLIVLEDLSDRDDVTFYVAGDEPPLSHSEGMMETLGKLHGRYWCSPRFTTDLSWVTFYSGRRGWPFAHQIIRMCEKRFMAQDRELPDTVRRLTKFYVDNRPALDRAWEALPPTVVHGDCHTGNTYRREDGTAGIYDWQNFHKMNGLRDVAYYISQSLSVESRRTNEKALIERYLDSLAANGAGHDAPSFAEAFDTYRTVVFDGWIAAFTTLAIGGMQDDDRVEIAAERSIAALVDLDNESALRDAARRAGG